MDGERRRIALHPVPDKLTKPGADVVSLVVCDPHWDAQNAPSGAAFAIHADGSVTTWGAPTFGV